MVEARTVATKAIAADTSVWPRRGLDHARVAEFAAPFREGGLDALPPLDVIASGNGFVLADGWHRLHALKALRAGEVRVQVLDAGTDTPSVAAYLHGLRTAATAALPLTRAELSVAVDRLLTDDPQRSDREVARLAGSSPTTVGAHRRRLTEPAVDVAGNGEMTERAYLSAVGADELARTLARALGKVFEQRDLSDYFLGDRTGKRLARALLDLHSPDDARAWAERLQAWASTAVAELGG